MVVLIYYRQLYTTLSLTYWSLVGTDDQIANHGFTVYAGSGLKPAEHKSESHVR